MIGVNHMTTKEFAFDRLELSDSFRQVERDKSNLLLEANFLHLQGEYAAASDRFALAADLETDLSIQLTEMENFDKAFIHLFSAVSCWSKAGDIHRAIALGEELLGSQWLSEPQRQQVAAYLDSLRNRMAQWMRQWEIASVQAAD